MEEKTTSHIYKKWWFWLILGVVALAIIGGIVGGTAGGGTKDNAPTGGTTNGDATGGTTVTTYYIGDTVTVGSLEVTVNSVSDTQLLGSDLLGAQTNQNFIVITLTVKNTKDKEETVTSSFMTLKRGNAEYEPHSGSIYLENGFAVLKEIGPGIHTTFSVAFEVPDKSTDSEYSLRVGGLLDRKEIVLKKN